jgi:transcriptional regulator with XRE-family HTH domain
MRNSKNDIGEMDVRRLFAQNLKRLRDLQRISQLQISVLTGLTHNFINDIENCKKWISADTLARLATALQVQPFQFFLSEYLAGQSQEDPSSIYREDFDDMFQKIASDWKSTYLPEPPDNKKKKD